MDFHKTLIVYNPVAGFFPSRSFIFELISSLSEKGKTPLVYITKNKEKTLSEVPNLAKECEDIVCCGGDGTLHEVVNALIGAGVDRPVSYIPIGTTNDFAHSRMIPTENKQALNLIGKAPQRMDVGRFEDKYFNYVACFGVFTKSPYTTPQNLKNTLGFMAYFIESLKDLASLSNAYSLTITTGDESFSGNYIFGAVTNTTNFAGFFSVPVKPKDLSDGLLEVILIREPDSLTEVPGIFASLVSGDYKDPHVELFQCKEVSFSCDEDVDWNLDGEYAGAYKEVKITDVKQALNIVTGYPQES